MGEERVNQRFAARRVEYHLLDDLTLSAMAGQGRGDERVFGTGVRIVDGEVALEVDPQLYRSWRTTARRRRRRAAAP